MGRPWAGYTRVSRVGDREDTLISPDLQAARITEYATLRGLDVHMLDPELDVSGGTLDRPILGDALKRVEDGTYSGIVVAQLDRLSRSITDALHVIRRVENAGGQVIAVAENFDQGTPEGRMARNVLLALGEMQLDRYKGQFRAAKRQAVKRGIWPMPKAPKGYRRGPGRSLEPSPDADSVRRAFEMRAAGKSWRHVADHLQVGMSTAHRMLRNRAYLGEIRVGKMVNLSAHPPLIDLATFEAAQLGHARPPVGRHGPALLTGLVKCDGCGYAMTPSTSAKGSHVERSYRCTAHNKRGPSCKTPAIISAPKLEAHVELVCLPVIGGEGFDFRERTDQLDRARETLTAAEGELAAYQQLQSVSDLGADVFLAGMTSRVVAVEDGRRALAEARLRAGPVPLAGQLLELWPDLTVEERRHLLRGLLSAVVVAKGTGPCVGRVRVFLAGDPDIELGVPGAEHVE